MSKFLTKTPTLYPLNNGGNLKLPLGYYFFLQQLAGDASGGVLEIDMNLPQDLLYSHILFAASVAGAGAIDEVGRIIFTTYDPEVMDWHRALQFKLCSFTATAHLISPVDLPNGMVYVGQNDLDAQITIANSATKTLYVRLGGFFFGIRAKREPGGMFKLM